MAAIKMGPKFVTGNVATDPTLMGQGDQSWVKIRLAEQQREYIKGQWKNGETVFYDVGVNDKQLGQHILNSVRSGDRITAIGNYSIEPYVDGNGNNGINHRLYAHEVAASLKFNDVQLAREINPSYGPQQTMSARRDADLQASQAEPAAETVNAALAAANKQYGLDQQQTFSPPIQAENTRLDQMESQYLASRSHQDQAQRPSNTSFPAARPAQSPTPGAQDSAQWGRMMENRFQNHQPDSNIGPSL